MQKTTFVTRFVSKVTPICWYCDLFLRGEWIIKWGKRGHIVWKERTGRGFGVLMVCKTTFMQKDWYSHDELPLLYCHLPNFHETLNIVFFCSTKKDLVKEVKQYITLDCFLWAPSTLICTVVCVLYVCICEHTRAHFSAFQWDFHELSQSWAPGSAGWRALLKALLKLVYFCAAERLCDNGFPNDCRVWQLNSEGLFSYLRLSWRFFSSQ